MGVFGNIEQDVVVIESGKAAILDFPPIESDPPPSVIWQDENGVLRYDQKYALTDKHQLIILSASKDDARPYRFIFLFFLLIFTRGFARFQYFSYVFISLAPKFHENFR